MNFCGSCHEVVWQLSRSGGFLLADSAPGGFGFEFATGSIRRFDSKIADPPRFLKQIARHARGELEPGPNLI